MEGVKGGFFDEDVYFRPRSVEAGIVAGSQAPALAVIHKCKRPVIPAGMAGSQAPAWEPLSLTSSCLAVSGEAGAWELEEIQHNRPEKVITYKILPHTETIKISPKAEVASMLEALSDDVSFEDIQYHLYVLEKVKRGLDRAETEGTLPHEEAKKRLHKWLAD
jgi:hypothetical protein